MSDTTSVNLYIATKDYQAALDMINDLLDGSSDLVHHNDGLTQITYPSVRDGVLDFENILSGQLIPYSYYWSSGDEFDAGQKHFRILQDGSTVKTTFDNARFNVVCLEELKNAAETGIELVEELIKAKENEFYVMPWDEQLIIDTRSLNDAVIEKKGWCS